MNLETTLDYKTSILACLMHELLSIKDQRVACLQPFDSACQTGSVSGYYVFVAFKLIRLKWINRCTVEGIYSVSKAIGIPSYSCTCIYCHSHSLWDTCRLNHYIFS